MTRLSLLAGLIVLTTQTWAQSGRPGAISAAQAQQLEDSLKANPGDKTARSALLNYYFGSAELDAGKVIEARRRHILWFIENAPGDAAMGGSAATIDPSGHPIADSQGYKQASEAWKAQIAKKDVNAVVLGNAAYFFKLSDNAFTIDLLERAMKLEPSNEQVAGFLGVEYAMAILGVTMVNKNGYPTDANPNLTDGPVAKKARQALDSSKNVGMLARAGYILSFQGSILRGAGKLRFDAAPLAESMLKRAASLDPDNLEVAKLLEQHRQMQAAISGKK